MARETALPAALPICVTIVLSSPSDADDSGQDDRRQQPGDATDRDSGNLPIGPAGDPDPYVYDTAYETHEEAMARLGLDGVPTPTASPNPLRRTTESLEERPATPRQVRR